MVNDKATVVLRKDYGLLYVDGLYVAVRASC